jgi:hypothetical protein
MKRRAARGAGERDRTDIRVPRPVAATAAAASGAGVIISILALPLWAVFATIGAIVSVGALHRHIWRWPPAFWSCIVLVVAASASGVVGGVLGNERDQATLPCGSAVAYRVAAAQSVQGDGQIERGNIVRARPEDSKAPFADPVIVSVGSTVEVRLRINNPGERALEDVLVAASLGESAARRLVVGMSVAASNATTNNVSDTVTLELRPDEAACPTYIGGSTTTIAANGSVSPLPDGITTVGVAVPRIAPSADNKRFVEFTVRLDPPPTAD